MADEISALDKKKTHRERKSGRKAERKKTKKLGDNIPTDKQPNPKAFGFNSAVKAERRFRRKQDIDTKKQHIPEVDRSPIEPPPILVGIVGPPKVGKTTLMNSLIKLYTKSPVTSIKGPVTIVVGKKQRVTLIECNNDINSMIDIAKVADIVLLLSDASFGFEMEMFEFINICQAHGMPRIMGVLTHLDMIKNSKSLKNTKKTLKHRFWTEVFDGAKLFYLSGILHGEYLRNEIKNLGRFISVMKLRPIVWRTSHSYLLADRYEDLTNQEMVRQNSKCDRNISLYGYVRGIPLDKNAAVHIAGLGDLQIQDISFLPDPCPLPEAIKKRALIEKEKLIYAPFSGVGGIVYDKDAVYVELGGSHSHTQRDEESNNIITNILNTEETLGNKIEAMEFQLFTNGEKFTAKDMDTLNPNRDEGRRKVVFEKDDEELLQSLSNSDSSDESDSGVDENDSGVDENDSASDDENSEDEDENNDQNDQQESVDNDHNLQIKWKENLAEKAKNSYFGRKNEQKNIMKLVYGIFEKSSINKTEVNNEEPTEHEELGGLFRVMSKQQQQQKAESAKINLDLYSLIEPWNSTEEDWLESDRKVLITNCFVTGKWKDSEDAAELLKLDDAEDSESEASDVYGDFEDLETGETYSASKEEPEDTANKDNKRKRLDEDDEKSLKKQKLAEKKRKLKEKFDLEYDNTDKTYYDELKSTVEKQSQLNKTVFENMDDAVRVDLEGYRPGMYVRIELQNVPCEFINNFDATYPLLVGALNKGEENIGFVNVQIKKHRWYKKILKTNDPLIVSLGWRRFQTLPIYSKLEDDLKYRYLKYTPQHVMCKAHFWGPITPQGTGFIALQSCDETSAFAKQGFRIAATGAVQELDKTTQIVKKLKLIGEPLKVYKKTAFVKGMFSTSLEVAKFEGAKIKTVSGIRGQIKKAANKPDGCFRATFEDKIQLSDIVFCRTWVKVNVIQFYNPVITLLLPHEKKNNWKGLRTTGEIKREEGLRKMPNMDSMYTEVTREEKPFKKLIIPKKLQEALPYKDKPKLPPHRISKEKRVAVIREPKERKVAEMMKMFKASYARKQKINEEQKKENQKQHKLKLEQIKLKQSQNRVKRGPRKH